MALYDVGIVGCWYWGNYGSLLNGYATFSLIKGMGLRPLNIVTPYNGFEPHAKKFFEAVYDSEDISECLPFERVNEFNNMCETFVTGSDQIWHNHPNRNEKERLYDYFFHLDFVKDDKKKISFSTSYGNLIPEKDEYYTKIRRLLERYDAISLREENGVDYLKKYYGINATQIIEPVMIVQRKLWENLIEKSDLALEDDYIFSYILDPTEKKRQLIKDFSTKMNSKSINALDGFSAHYNYNKEKLNLENTLPNIWAADFLKCFAKAKFVITDSFHGMCFAMIFNKPFIAIANDGRGIDRFKSILDMCMLRDRLIDINNIEKLSFDTLTQNINYDHVNDIIEKKANEGRVWLENKLKTPKSEIINKVGRAKVSVNNLLSIEKCVGCGACFSVCPANAIKLSGDEYGIYRSYVDEDNCIKCGKCVAVCPALEQPKNLNSDNPTSYAFIHNDCSLLKESSSGGAFSALAQIILENKGVVVGASWRDDFRVEHIAIDNIDDLYKLRKSKYFQSYMGKTYKFVKDYLEDGRRVLFTGTPCQMVGLKKYLGRYYSNLILVDLLCANCPSAEIFNKYICEKDHSSNIKQYNFRHKKETNEVWDAKSVLLEMKNGEKIVKDIDNDMYLKVYHTCSLALSSQCMDCKYQGNKRYGDITIGDCWGVDRFDSTLNHKYGVSAIIVNNEKGQDLVDAIDKANIGTLKIISLADVKKYNVLAFLDKRGWKSSLRRNKFMNDIKENAFSVAVQNALSLKIDGLSKLEIESIDKDSIEFVWEVMDNNHYDGLIIEERINGEWTRIARIGDNNEKRARLENKNRELKHEFRAKAFYFDGSVALYSDYKNLKIQIQ